MAKAKTQPKKVKKTPTKYSKLLVVAQKELEAKKKALVSAERALGKAKQKHEELIAEVARLDMVERSLKAVVEGTEPPTNVKYVYNYPQWVWYPAQPYVTYTTPSWQYTPSTTVPNNGGWTFTNTPNLPNNGAITCNAQNGVLTTTAAGLSGTFQSGTVNSGSLPEGNFSGLCLNNSSLTFGDAPQAQSFAGLVVDLSTGAEPTDAPQEPVEAAVATKA